MIKFKSVLSAILLIIVFSICNITYATETTIADTKKESHCFHLFSASWTPIQLSCVPVSLFDDRSDIYGINIALWLGTFPNNVYGFSYASIANFAWKKHCGISISGIWMMMGDNYGVSIAPANMIHRNNGLMLGLINIGPMGDTMGNGIQIGLVNQATGGLQIGLINYNSNALIPWMPLFNFSFDNKSKE